MEEEEEEEEEEEKDQVEDRHVFEMSTLISILPFKRGLSKHYDGKSQSFPSLAHVRCLEDLAKPERTWKKKRFLPCLLSPKALISKKPSRVPPSFTNVILKKTSHFL